VAILASVHGASFFILFSIMGWMTHRVGLGYMTIVAKMSLVIPVLFSWLFYGDAMAWLRFVGVGLALAAIWMVHFGEQGRERPMDPQEHPWRVPALSAILFLGSGASDALFRVIQQEYSGLVDHRAYVIVLFAAAAAASLPVFVYKGIHGTLRLHAPTVLGGLLMGIPNYYSIVFLAGALRYFDGTVFYPVNNTAILLVMALAGIVFFGERLNGWKVAGLLVATGAVVMLNG
jgi:drug/metabolite transporter (DMT)-like permease